MIVPGKPFLIAGALAWSGIVAAMVTGWRGPERAVSAPVVVASTEFGSRWDFSADDYPMLKKTDRLAVAESGPVEVKTERVALATPKSVEGWTEPVVIKLKKSRHAESNICTRHGMRKVEIRGGRSWRCRR